MTIVYFDSSSCVKLLVEEDESDVAAALWDGCDAAISSRLAFPEVRAALAAAGRDRRLTPEAQHAAEELWDEFWAATRVVQLTDDIATRAGELAGEFALRGADAVHLASALVLGGEGVVFAAWDQRLRAGAERVGMVLAPQRAVGE